VTEILRTLDDNRYFENQEPYCEPQLGKRGLYRNTGGRGIPDRESAMLWLLNQCDGSQSLLDIAERSGIAFDSLAAVAAELRDASLLSERRGQVTK
jgi:aminopeptidase-like protein